MDVLLPQLPSGSDTATVVRWLKAQGDAVTAGEPILMVVNEQVEVALPALVDGRVVEVSVAEGETVPSGTRLARLAPVPPVAPPSPARRATPVALRVAQAAGVDLSRLSGSGPDGRISKEDVLLAIAGDRAPPITPFELHGIEARDSSRVSASDIERAGQTGLFPVASPPMAANIRLPYVVTVIDVDCSPVQAYLARHGQREARRGGELTEATLLAFAAVAALQRYPMLNSVWREDSIVVHHRVHLAMRLTQNGRVTTQVLQNAQDLNLCGLARAIARLRGADASAHTPAAAATMTIAASDGAWWGAEPDERPQTALLSLGAPQLRPTVISAGGNDRLVVQPVALLSLRYDARVLDQPLADAYLTTVRHILERVEQ
jgi:2-oxoglutarate dehydrogenase E2 component (dihydrolipoamide succinyltransferase)